MKTFIYTNYTFRSQVPPQLFVAYCACDKKLQEPGNEANIPEVTHMKNWEPFVFGPLLAMERRNG